jgi:hypothetical protein
MLFHSFEFGRVRTSTPIGLSFLLSFKQCAQFFAYRLVIFCDQWTPTGGFLLYGRSMSDSLQGALFATFCAVSRTAFPREAINSHQENPEIGIRIFLGEQNGNAADFKHARKNRGFIYWNIGLRSYRVPLAMAARLRM